MLRQIFKKTGIILFCVLLICTLLPANMSVDAFAAETEATAKIELRIDKIGSEDLAEQSEFNAEVWLYNISKVTSGKIYIKGQTFNFDKTIWNTEGGIAESSTFDYKNNSLVGGNILSFDADNTSEGITAGAEGIRIATVTAKMEKAGKPQLLFGGMGSKNADTICTLKSGKSKVHEDIRALVRYQSESESRYELWESDWASFRGNSDNNGITNYKTPIDAEHINLKWASRQGEDYQANVGPALIVGDFVYTATTNQLLQLDKESGKIKSSCALSGTTYFNTVSTTYGVIGKDDDKKGVIFVSLNGGKIQAIEATTLTSLWTSQPVGGQNQCPVVYDEETQLVYCGYWTSENDEGTYVCLDANSGDIKWRISHLGGFYWAGAAIVGDYLVVGSDNGDDKSGIYDLTSALEWEASVNEANSTFGYIGDDENGQDQMNVEFCEPLSAGNEGIKVATIQVSKAVAEQNNLRFGGWRDDNSAVTACVLKDEDGQELFNSDKETIKTSYAYGKTDTKSAEPRIELRYNVDNVSELNTTKDIPVEIWLYNIPAEARVKSAVVNINGFQFHFLGKGGSKFWYNNSDGDLSTLYVLDKRSGKIMDSSKTLIGDQRSTITHYKEGKIYFTTKQGFLYSALIQADGKIKELKGKKYGSYLQSTGTPTVYKDRVYFGLGGLNSSNSCFMIADAQTLDEIYRVPMNGYPQSSALLTTAYEDEDGEVYVYITCNRPPGGITILKDKKGQTEPIAEELFIPPSGMKQYCLSSIITDSDGNLYYLNDSGTLFSLEKSNAALNTLELYDNNGRKIDLLKEKKSFSDAGFHSSYLSYYATTAHDVPFVTLRFEPSKDSIVEINGQKVVDDNKYILQLDEGEKTAAIKVTNGGSSKTYTIAIKKGIHIKSSTIKKDGLKNILNLESDGNGRFYYIAVDKAEKPPEKEVITREKPIEFNSGVSEIVLNQSKPGDIVYYVVEDAQGNYSDVYAVTIPNDSSGEITDKVNVSFRLIGSTHTKTGQGVDLSRGRSGYNGAEYQTWIVTKTYSLEKGSSVYDLFMQATKEAGIVTVGAEQNYVKTIYAPTRLGGEPLSEFTNGPYSGWMYTVNGAHPNVGLQDYKLQDGETVVWHYVNDYRYEPADWSKLGGTTHPAARDTTFHNEWLKAPDRIGGTGGGNPAAEEVNSVTTDTKAGTTAAPTEVKVSEKTNADGTKTKVATVTVSADNQKEILKQAKDNKSKEIILVVSKDSVKDAEKAEVTLDKSFVDSIIKDTDAKLTIKTPFDDKTYTQEELKALSAGATGSTIIITVGKAEEPIDDNAEKVEKAKALTKEMKLTARSAKTAKKNIKITVKTNSKTTAAIKELKDLGYTVKYRYYRSTKKASAYKSSVTKSTKTYLNTAGKKGRMYYYKAQVRVYDENGKLIAKTALKQCKYANRAWSR